ncbi:MAG: OmpA family protein [Aquificaceae bacterium]
MRRVLLLSLVLAGGISFAEEKLDPCGSPKEVYSKYLLDKCYKGYFDAIIDAKKKSEEALDKANEALDKTKNLEGRVGKLEDTVQDHEKRIKALEEKEFPKWQLEEIGAVHFDFDKFNIKPQEAKKLDDIVQKIKGDTREIFIVGFADTRGTSKYNFNLSMYRAQMVASYLAKKGVDIGRMRIASYGKEVAELISPKYAEQRAVRVYFIK